MVELYSSYLAQASKRSQCFLLSVATILLLRSWCLTDGNEGLLVERVIYYCCLYRDTGRDRAVLSLGYMSILLISTLMHLFTT